MALDPARSATDKLLAKMEKKLTAIYRRANKEIGESWKAYMEESSAKIKPLQDAYDAAKKAQDEKLMQQTGKALSRAKRDQTLKNQHYKNMTEQLAKELSNVNDRAVAYINDQLPTVYATNYNYTAQQIELNTDNAISFELPNERAIKNIIDAGDKALLPLYDIDKAKDVAWNVRSVNAEVLQGIIQGESMAKIAKRLEKVGMQNAGSSIRAARTIVTSVENKARYDSAKSASDKGVVLKKEWIAAHDSRTRDWHRQAGDTYGTRATAIPIDEKFQVGGDEMMYAGDSSASAANLYNCRCATVYFPDGFTSILPPEKRGSIRVRFND